LPDYKIKSDIDEGNYTLIDQSISFQKYGHINGPYTAFPTHWKDGQPKLHAFQLSKDTDFSVYTEKCNSGRDIIHITSQEPFPIESYFTFVAKKKRAKPKRNLSAVFPTFKYFANPIAEDSFMPSDEECIICSEQRGYVNEFNIDDGPFCPWCFAEGKVAKELELEFNESDIFYSPKEWDRI
jgi:hypothetical protein